MRILEMVFFVRFAYTKIQALIMVEDGRNPGPCMLLVATQKALNAVKDLWISEIDGSFFFFFFFFNSNLTSKKNWPIKIGRKSKTAQSMEGELVCPIMARVPVCLSLLAKYSMPARQIDKFAPLHTLKSVVVSPKTDCQSKKWFSYGAQINLKL